MREPKNNLRIIHWEGNGDACKEVKKAIVDIVRDWRNKYTEIPGPPDLRHFSKAEILRINSLICILDYMRTY